MLLEATWEPSTFFNDSAVFLACRRAAEDISKEQTFGGSGLWK